MQEMGTWLLKKEQSVKWLQLSDEQKINDVNSQIIIFDLLFAESDILLDDSDDQKIEKINLLANKITLKYKDLETVYGQMFLLRSKIKKQFEDLLNLENIDVYQEMENIFLNNDI